MITILLVNTDDAAGLTEGVDIRVGPYPKSDPSWEEENTRAKTTDRGESIEEARFVFSVPLTGRYATMSFEGVERVELQEVDIYSCGGT